MSIEAYRKMAAKMDQHMQQLANQNVHEDHLIIDRMMGYTPDLHKIWVGATDTQLMALANEFPRFYRYALIMEDAFAKERNKTSRPYDGTPEFSEPLKETMAAILTTAATLERGYQTLLEEKQLSISPHQANELDTLYRKWLLDLECFKKAIKSDSSTTKMQHDYVEIGMDRITSRITSLVKCSAQ